MATEPREAPVAARASRRPSWPLFWMALLTVLLLTGTVRALSTQPRSIKPFLADSRPVVLAHQGASGHSPSNTLESFRLALAQGADILELDVHMTRDGVVVVSHDETIDRMSNGSGAIREMTLAELRQYDFGHDFSPDGGLTFPYRGKGVTIPTLEEVFQAFPGVRVNIEMKQVEPAMETAVWELVQQYRMEEKVLVNSFHSEPVRRWQALAGDRTALGATRGHMYEFAAYYLLHLDRLYQPRVDAFQLPTQQRVGPFTLRLDTPRLIETAHRLGIKVHYWTINDEATMERLLLLGADGIITDYPDRAVPVMERLGLR